MYTFLSFITALSLKVENFALPGIPIVDIRLSIIKNVFLKFVHKLLIYLGAINHFVYHSIYFWIFPFYQHTCWQSIKIIYYNKYPKLPSNVYLDLRK